MDRVRPIKIESPSGGGTEEDFEYTPAEPGEDAIEVRGLYVQDDTSSDETTLVTRSGDDMTFQDANNPAPVTLTSLTSGAGVPATSIGQILFSLNGTDFAARKPIVGTNCWLADDSGELIVEG